MKNFRSTLDQFWLLSMSVLSISVSILSISISVLSISISVSIGKLLKQSFRRFCDLELSAENSKFTSQSHLLGGLTLDHSNPNRLVLSRYSLTSNQFEIELWMTHDEGSTWTQTPVTSQSRFLNVRPIIPRQYSADTQGRVLILWMTGTYQYWTNYSTALNYAFVDL